MTRELLNTLYVQTDGAFLRLDHDALRVEADGVKLLQVPLHHLGGIFVFGNIALSTPLLIRCAEEGRAVVYFDRAGRFRARLDGPTSGNVLLRQAQYEAHRDSARTRDIARAVVAGKIRNLRQVVLRGARDTRREENAEQLGRCAAAQADLLLSLPEQAHTDAIRGIEGQASALYFETFGCLLSVPPAEFAFTTRTRRPPRDRVNAVLSFLYALLSADCTAACEGVGLDPQFGFLHALRPGRPSLALDLMEEFRPLLADRVALTLINRRQIRVADFEAREGAGESVSLTESGRRTVIAAYQERKQEEVVHPFLKDKAPLGLLPHLQARLLARHLRGDLPAYLPFTA